MSCGSDATDRDDGPCATSVWSLSQTDRPENVKAQFDHNVKVAGCKAGRNISCESCSEELTVDEVGLCENCTAKLCNSCYDIFKSKEIGPLQHIILQEKKKQNQCTETCKKHIEKVVDCFCEICDKIGCSVCMVTEHRECPKDSVKYVPDIAGTFLDSKEYQNYLELLDQFGTDLDTEIEKCKSNKRRADFLHKRATEEIKKQRDKINKLFDQFQNNIEKEERLKHEQNTKLLESVALTQKYITQNVTRLKSKLEDAQIKGNSCQLFLDVKTGEEALEHIQTDILNIRKENEIPYYEIEFSTALQTALRDVGELGKLTTLHRDIKVNADLTVSSRKDLLPFCCITGMCAVSKDKLLISDYKNSRLKVIDTNKYKVQSELILPGPWAVAKAGENNFAVTLPTIKAIQFLSLTSSFSIFLVYQLLLRGSCRSIVCTEKKMVVSYFDASLHVLDIRGNVLNDLTVDSDGEKRFEKPWNVALSPDKTIIYVSDLGKHMISSITFDGEVKAIYKDEENGGPRGLTVDRTGAIYVCCYLSNKIIQLSKDLVQVCVLLDNSDGIDKHRCLTYCDKNNKLFVGKWEEDLIKVFHVK
ncbi:uncharacterized protein LOC128546772 [Mercenaria mercenaria]|uniref:uncharacterized protein LOC128546772 n=1 Tax=Mercenaria mercenaria TaxID=6596 RepID=UPI00234EF4A3|nr:uncharacterized protein LOC128546772 [Mercenaria mercenaria]